MNRLVLICLFPLGLCQALVRNNVSFVPPLSSLPLYVTPTDSITITATTTCTAPAAVITWRYQQRVPGIPSSCTSSFHGSCPRGQVRTQSTVTIQGNTTSLFNRQISLAASIEHDSFDPPTNIRSQATNVIQFPVPVKRVTLTKISSGEEMTTIPEGKKITLTCVTSASFPSSTVTWSGLPLGSKTNTSHETLSGQLVETTSTVTFTSSSGEENTIQCQASNIDDQLAAQSEKLLLNATSLSGNNSLLWIIVGCCIGGLVIIVLIAVIIVLCRKKDKRGVDSTYDAKYDGLQDRQQVEYETLDL